MIKYLLFLIPFFFTACETSEYVNRVQTMINDGYNEQCVYQVVAKYGVTKEAQLDYIYKVSWRSHNEVLRLELDICELKLENEELKGF